MCMSTTTKEAGDEAQNTKILKVSVEDIRNCIRRTERNQHGDEYVIKIPSREVENDVCETKVFCEQRENRYPPEWKPVPIHIDPVEFLSDERTAPNPPNRRDQRRLFKKEHNIDGELTEEEKEQFEDWYDQTIEVWGRIIENKVEAVNGRITEINGVEYVVAIKESNLEIIEVADDNTKLTNKGLDLRDNELHDAKDTIDSPQIDVIYEDQDCWVLPDSSNLLGGGLEGFDTDSGEIYDIMLEAAERKTDYDWSHSNPVVYLK